MSTLIVTLPFRTADASAEFGFVLTPDGRVVAREGSARPTLLPLPGRTGGDVVAVVPAGRLSWHQVDLPKGTSAGTPRLRAVLEGLLEDRVLDEPQTLHFAAAPGARPGAPVWVAVCDRAWLRGALVALDGAQRAVSRVVPEFWPGTDNALVYAVGEPEDAQLIRPGTNGVTVLPLSAAGVAMAQAGGTLTDTTQVVAEPAVAALAEQLMQRQVSLRTPAQRALQAAESPWDLLQFDLSSTSGSRAMKRLNTGWRDWLRAPQWRAARWGVALFAAANLVGLNAWGWKERSALNAKRTEVQALLTQTFPTVKVVVDAPVQMEREVAALRQAAGATSGGDLEAILSALGPSVPPERTVSAIEFAAGEARVMGLGLGEEEQSIMTANLQSQGFAARTEGDSVIVRTASADAPRNGSPGARP
jgi:general secretion pathway protein L